MPVVRMLLGTVPLVFAGVCVGTTIAQLVGLAVVWQSGGLSQEKMVRYAAVLYGLDLADLPSGKSTTDTPQNELMTREQILDARVSQSELLQNRRIAVGKGTDNMRLVFDSIRSDNDRFEQMKARFDSHLAQLEEEARADAIREVERTLAILPQKQAKDLILRMLDDQGQDPDDDVMADVVTILKAMPQDKRKKILGEFKTEPERLQLHEIIVEIGQLESN